MPSEVAQKAGAMRLSRNVVNDPEEHDEIEVLGSQRSGERLRLDDEVVLDQMHVGHVGEAFGGMVQSELAGVDAAVGEGLDKPLAQESCEASVAAADVEDPW